MLSTDNALHKDDGIDISVVIPSYNHVQFIAQAIDSVIAQTLQSWELIVVDDGSTDGTPALLDKVYSGNGQIRLVYQTNHGAHHAINTGIALAKGRYISILNSDDIYHPERLKTLLEHCEATGCGLAFTKVTPIDAQGEPILEQDHPWCRLYARLIQEYQQDGARLALLTGNFAVTTSNFFFRADLLKAVGGFHRQRYNHDWEFMVRLILRGHCIERVGDQPLLFYRLHGNNTITQNTLMARLELKRILQNLVPVDDPYLVRLFSRMQLNMRSIRHEYLARVVQQIRIRDGNEIQNMQKNHALQIEELQESNQALIETRENLLQQTASLQLHLAQIQSSRAFRFARFLSRSYAVIKSCWAK